MMSPPAPPKNRAHPLLCCALALTLGSAACDTIGSVALEAGDFAGAKADAHCDRRFVSDGGKPAAFCQEIVATVAASEFADDCRAKHQATAAPGPCPRARIIAGCMLQEKHDDDSVVRDWYYDVSDIVADAGSRRDASDGPIFDGRPLAVTDVAKTCADRSRYESGAELVLP
ncbi:MAG TPA: hypothetical protein VM925_04085 [Labilithrix sp.]|nr:hypothetical protein [Labilithrix sp.]